MTLEILFYLAFDYSVSGGTMKIKLIENVCIQPIHVNTTRKTAYAHQKATKAELDRLVRLGVIKK